MTNKKLIVGLLLAITITLTITSNNAYASPLGGCGPDETFGFKAPPVITSITPTADGAIVDWTQSELHAHILFFFHLGCFLPTNFEIFVDDTSPVDVTPIINDDTILGGDSGTFVITGLEPNTSYFVRVDGLWATSSFGGSILEGTEEMFTTNAIAPDMIDDLTVDLDGTTATFTWLLDDFNGIDGFDNNSPLTDLSLECSLNEGPFEEIVNLPLDAEEVTVEDLDYSTDFVCRIKATNSAGITSSNEVTFTTPARPSNDNCVNCQRPSIGVTEHGNRVVDGGITVNGNTVNADFYFTPFPLIQANINEKVTMHFTIWDDVKNNIAHVEVGLGKGKIGESFAKLENSMFWDRHVMTKNETVTFDETMFKDVTMEMVGKTNCLYRSGPNNNECDLFKVEFTPIKAIVGDVVFGISIWDDNRNAMTTFFNEGLQIGTESDVIQKVEFVAPQGTGNKSYPDLEEVSPIVLTRTSQNFNLVKQYELDRANASMQSLFPKLFEEVKHSETIKVTLNDSINFDSSIEIQKISQ